LVTTEKDAVKLAGLRGFDGRRVLVACVGLEFLDDGDLRLQGLLENTMARRNMA
jgi:hypothetical protein